MTIEESLFSVVGPLMANRFYPDVAPASAKQHTYGTYQQIGGQSLSFMEGGAAPSKRHGRFQISLWADTRAAVSSLALQVDNAMRAATAFQAEPLGEPLARHDPEPGLYGSTQDFSIWYDRP